MAEDRDRDAPSLEPPSLFGRKRRKVAADRPTREPVDPRADPSTGRPVDPAEPADPDTIFDDTTEPTPAAVSPLTPPPAPEPPRRAQADHASSWLTGRPAAILTGLIVGGLIVAATAGSLRICTEVKGTSSCGGQGFFLLMAILAVAVLLGAALLRFAQVSRAGQHQLPGRRAAQRGALLFLVESIFSGGW